MIDASISGHYVGDCRDLLKQIPDACVQTCVTSPPYWGLRDYGSAEQIGLESTPAEYVDALVSVFREVRRVLRDNGTLWLNLGDTYANSSSAAGGKGKQHTNHGSVQMRGHTRCIPDGMKPKDLIGIPWMVAFALRADGWFLRSDIIWHKPNAMPASVTDRCTTAHEHVFMLAKCSRYYFDASAIAEPAVSVYSSGNGYQREGRLSRTNDASANTSRWTAVGGTRNCRSVWSIPVSNAGVEHFATMAPLLAARCVLAGSRHGDVVLDPFFGSGTTGLVAEKHERKWIGLDLDYFDVAKARTAQRSLGLSRLDTNIEEK